MFAKNTNTPHKKHSPTTHNNNIIMTVWTTAASYLFYVTFGAHAASAAVEGGGWLSGLPWDELKAKLSPSASLIDTSYEDYAAECIPEFVNFKYIPGERSNFALINQVSNMFARPRPLTVGIAPPCIRLRRLTLCPSHSNNNNNSLLVSAYPTYRVHMRNATLVRVRMAMQA